MDPDLEELAAAQLTVPDLDGVLVVDDAPNEVLECFFEHDQASVDCSVFASAASVASGAGASSTATSAGVSSAAAVAS